jgi:hypothetical protein
MKKKLTKKGQGGFRVGSGRKKDPNRGRTRGFYLSQDTYEDLCSHAQLLGLRTSHLVEMAIKEYIGVS